MFHVQIVYKTLRRGIIYLKMQVFVFCMHVKSDITNMEKERCKKSTKSARKSHFFSGKKEKCWH